jgi:hypothetical protein
MNYLLQTILTMVSVSPFFQQQLLDLLKERPVMVSPHKDAVSEVIQLSLRKSSINDSEIESRWKNLNFHVEQLKSEATQILFSGHNPPITFEDTQFVINQSPEAKPVFLQAPHRFFDQYTGEIGMKLFTELSIRIFAWNTRHRKVIDLAHSHESFLQLLTKSFLSVYPHGIILQLHGFNADKHNRAPTDAIISSGGSPSALARSIAKCIKKNFPEHVIRLFGEDADFLGATTNSQKHLIQELGRGEFIHIEASLRLRKMLLSDPSQRRNFLSCILP